MDDNRRNLAALALTHHDDDAPKPTDNQNPKTSLLLKHSGFVSALEITVLLVVMLAAIWTFGNVYFAKFRMNNANLSSNIADSVLSKFITAQADAYHFSVAYPDGKIKNFAIKDTGIKIDPTATIVDLRKQRASLSGRLKWWQPITVKLKTTVNNVALQEFIDKNATLIVRPATNAVLTLQNGTAQISDSANGTEYSLQNPALAIKNVVESLQATSVKLKLIPAAPTLTTQELSSAKSTLDQALQQKIVFNVSNQAITATPADIAAWIVVTPKSSSKTVDLSVDSNKVLDFVNNISLNYVRAPRNQVVSANSDGSTSVITAGQSGQDISNKNAVAQTVAANLLAGKGESLTLQISTAPFKTVTIGSSTNKWIEVDTTTKRMYAYEDGTLVRTFLVSAGASRTPTVLGKFKIFSKLPSQDMTGYNTDGSTYYQPAVPWVNYFYPGYAIHGNYWRPTSWFGSINSSHGCVGLMVADGQWVYYWAPIGTPVIIHT